MKKTQYTQPQIYIENVVVENGIATSMTYGISTATEITRDEEGEWAF